MSDMNFPIFPNTALPAGITPIVRINADALDEGTRVLDNGAQGVLVPQVDTAAQAQRVAQALCYAPTGRRNWGTVAALFGFRPPAEFADARFQSALRSVIDAATRHGKFVGMGGLYDEALMRACISQGVRLLAAGSDQAFVLKAASERALALRRLATATTSA